MRPGDYLTYAQEDRLRDHADLFMQRVHVWRGSIHDHCRDLGDAELMRTAEALCLVDNERTAIALQYLMFYIWHGRVGQLLRQKETREYVTTLFRSARYGLPLEMVAAPETITLWRGGRVNNPDDLSGGLSWTTDRAMAAKYAISPARGFEYGTPPALISAQFQKSDVHWHYNSAAYLDLPNDHCGPRMFTVFHRGEGIPDVPPNQWSVDDNLKEWVPLGLRYWEESKRACLEFLDGRYPPDERQRLIWAHQDERIQVQACRFLWPYFPSTAPADVL